MQANILDSTRRARGMQQDTWRRRRAPSASPPAGPIKPDWHRHATAAPFKRNDALLETLPIVDFAEAAGSAARMTMRSRKGERSAPASRYNRSA